MNIKDKSCLPEASNTNGHTTEYFNLRVCRLQIYSLDRDTNNVRITVYSELYKYIYFELKYPHEEIRGIATYAGLLNALVKGEKVKIKATTQPASQGMGLIESVEFFPNN
ncbi:hypothetical protein ID856_12890 [Xenorhabdus sp. 18]|uniref:hypothetical protein n=1 Tax=Xenorhabdus doucetiae TaxID=351671 RepID=UPI0019BA36EB|nr:hypothetical protein [Xenorhabdus sp. 18]MBD2797431.1 hypothetical protein [Xenorhabdus sp. 18]